MSPEISTILLAEDNPADVYLIREALREHGINCNIREASDGKEVLSLLAPTQAGDLNLDLIILDLNLPRHDGIEILQYIRDNRLLTHVPVVVLTSSDSPRDRSVANELGARRYLRKPSNLSDFMSLGAVFRDLLHSPTKGSQTEKNPGPC